jgi:hypothetical protein
MTESYKSQYNKAARASYVKKVVSQPTQQSNVKVVVDSKSPSGIREVKK